MNIFLILLLAFIIYYFFTNYESFTNLSIQDQDFVSKLFDYINNNDLSYGDYLQYLNSVKNTNLKIIDNEVFVGFKIAKKNKTFTKESISSEM
jgi:hypothetical protein